jgi:chemotaxis protein methyltransferase CheR
MKTMKGKTERLSHAEFKQFRNLIYDQSGINLNDSKQALLKSRLRKRMAAVEIDSYSHYFDFVKKDKTGKELTILIDSISTNVTSFFREIKHFEFLDKTIIPELVKDRKPSSGEVRAWSSACSSGEEPYSILFSLLENKEIPSSWKIKMLATDISTRILATAQEGFYEQRKISTVPKTMLIKYFTKDGTRNKNYFQIKQNIRSKIAFKKFNLTTPRFPFNKKFSFIFCRNVMIYFDLPTRETLVNKFYEHLEDDGYLLIGHSESLSGISHKFKYVQPTIYKKVKSKVLV